MEGEYSFVDIIRDDESKKKADKEATSFASPKMRAYSSRGLRDEDKVDAMMPQQFTFSLQPAQCWDGKYTKELVRDAADNLPDINAISTSFLPCGVSLGVSSTTDFLTVKTMGWCSCVYFFPEILPAVMEGKRRTM